jgi:hypothetical protein
MSKKSPKKKSDYRGIPSAMCPCGSNLLKIVVAFDHETYEINSYLIDNASCFECGSLLTAPTPLDILL